MFAESVENAGKAQLVTPFRERRILYAFHDIDGTHSLIRDWVPVMTLILGWISENGLLPEDGDSALELLLKNRTRNFEEAHRFSLESAGLSALTQMEWAVRNAMDRGLVPGVVFDREINRRIIRGIWDGEELFDGFHESDSVRTLIREKSSSSFRVYEKLLLAMCRDENLAAARKDPERWRVPGSMEFLQYLRDSGVKNYFVTGAVVEYGSDGVASGTMVEEVLALGYEIGPGKLMEGIAGSVWNEKLPKEQIMENLCRELDVDPENVLVVGDGRSEIEAGSSLGCVTLSRLSTDSVRAREIHKALKTNYILESYDPDTIRRILPAELPETQKI